ncbi:hypothetical protein B0H16DRAFT_1856462 [Mycena metata]|uniref:Uncharacterized protein n=1 Tax=Mycena metata TaxID=1033252 RepID=A0AAD7DGC8_9AGAR|nr:hypothetical protein B0H16DRAFT_1856462 [Mycena metata]
MDRFAVVDTPSLQNGVDLLRNRNVGAKLGAFDGRVAAHITIDHTPCYITSNAAYIPEIPPSGPDSKLFVRQDMRYGPDDPTLWPQKYSHTFCHLGAIPRQPTTEIGRLALGMMFWNPEREDFISPESGKTITRGLGKLRQRQYSKLAGAAEILLEECRKYAETARDVVQVFPLLQQTLKLGLERLQSVPSTYQRMVLEVTNLQRTYLELKGLLDYVTIYKPRMDNPASEGGHPEDCVGIFTDDPVIAQLFNIALLPCWLIRPLAAFTWENILRVVEPLEMVGVVVLEAADGYPSVPVGANIDKKMYSLHLCTRNAPWYKNPLPSPGAVSPPADAVLDPPSTAGPSRAPEHSQSSRSENRSPSPDLYAVRSRAGPKLPAPSYTQQRVSPYAAQRQKQKELKAARGPNPNAKVERDKYVHFDRPDMATAIPSWETALAGVDRAKPPSFRDPSKAVLKAVYVFPEPALLISAEHEERRQVFLHHYEMIRDALLYRMGDPDDDQFALTVQQWRDVLQGKLVAQGKAEQRTVTIESILGPAIRACGLDPTQITFPVDSSAIPRTTRNRARELTWELAELNFRYELLALDIAASRLQRSDRCRDCFPTRKMLGMDYVEGKQGFAAISLAERHPYIFRLAMLMLDWIPRPRPACIRMAERMSKWSEEDMRKLERDVTRYYTFCFYNVFGRAAIVPLRLTHEFGT